MKVNLSKKQLNALAKGRNITLKHGDLGIGNFEVHPDMEKKLAQAYRLGKGIRMHGSGLVGEGIFGKKFDRGLKKAGIKKGVFTTARILKPAVNAGMDFGVNALTQAAMANPMLAPAVPAAIYAKNMTSNYMDTPTKYQSSKGAKSLAKKSAVDSMKDVTKFALKQGVQAYNAPPAPVSGKGLNDPFKERSLKGFNAVNGQNPSFAPENRLAQDMMKRVENMRKAQAYANKGKGKYHTLPYPTVGSGIKTGRGIRGRGIENNPYIPTRLLSSLKGMKSMTGGSIKPSSDSVGNKLFTDGAPNIRPEQVGFDFDSKFLPRPNRNVASK